MDTICSNWTLYSRNHTIYLFLKNFTEKSSCIKGLQLLDNVDGRHKHYVREPNVVSQRVSTPANITT